MYKDFYGLREYPFNMTPDPQFLFLSKNHRVALDVLRFGIQERKGFLVITGEIGAGKTTVCRSLLRSLDANTKTALLLNPSLSDSQILKTICDEFKLQPAKTTKKDLYDTLNAFLLRELAANHNVVLIVDEAQNLRPKALEQIRLLSNLETEKEKLLQIILVGQPELAKLLHRDDLVQLKQRVALRHHIPPLVWEEIGEYIQHRLEVAGGAGRIRWTDGALLLIRRYSRGVPRLINVLCDKALMAGYVAESFTIDAGFVQRGIEDIEGAPVAEELKVGVE
ncbi:MAG: IS481 family transposase ISChy3 [Verrucomicrobiae bacterium]|nr:IS481 family transposase ISChy3 [Verrucomicrobiae bacterium]